MATRHPDDSEHVDETFRMIELRAQAEELYGEQLDVALPADWPPELARTFWEQFVAHEEKTPHTTHADRLARIGVDLPAPELLNDIALTFKLREVIVRLGQMHVFLINTDHLSDRELYTHLWTGSLREPIPDLPTDAGINYHLDMVGTGTEDDVQLWLKHYAAEEDRLRWTMDFPDLHIPDHEDPPYQRDRTLPRPWSPHTLPPQIGLN